MTDSVFTNLHGAGELTGLSEWQLRTWDRADVVTPQIADGDRTRRTSRLYSFRDLVALRVLGKLRGVVPPSELLKVQPWLKENDGANWSDLFVTVCGQSVRLGDSRRNVEIPGCDPIEAGITIHLAEIVDALRADIERHRQRRPEDIGQITRKRGVMGYAWIVAGTRIPTSAIWSFHEAGYDAQRIIEQYPRLMPEDIEAAIEHEQGIRQQGAA